MTEKMKSYLHIIKKKLEFNAETKIKDFFGNNSDIEIEVNDVNNILPTVPFQKYNILL